MNIYNIQAPEMTKTHYKSNHVCTIFLLYFVTLSKIIFLFRSLAATVTVFTLRKVVQDIVEREVIQVCDNKRVSKLCKHCHSYVGYNPLQ